jgi:hypothetical protein
MTPHHPHWHDGSVAPTDFDSPIPVSFLSVAGTFRIAVSWCGPATDNAKNWTELAQSLLRTALADWGIGGKTTSGYGRLVDPVTNAHHEPRPATSIALPKAGESVEGVLEEKTKKGGWRARHEPTALSGPIHNSNDVPKDLSFGDRVQLIVASANKNEIAFRYPTPTDRQRLQKL